MHCKRCKKKVSQYAKMCPYCHTPLAKNERVTRQYIKMLTEDRMTHKKDGKKFDKKMGFAFLGVALAVSLLLISYKHRMKQWQVGSQTVFYLGEDGLQAKDLKTGKKRQVAELSKEQSEERFIGKAEACAFHCSADRKKVFYAAGISKEDPIIYDIFERRLGEWIQSSVRIAEGVRINIWDQNDNLYYAMLESRMLYKYDGTKTQAIELPLIKEVIRIKGRNAFLVISYEERHDSSRYDFSTYDETDRLAFYVLDLEKFAKEKLCERKVESYAYRKDGSRLYYQVDNVLYEYDLLRGNEKVFEKNVYEFLMVNEGNDEKLYYITYDIVEKNLYDYVKDPWRGWDEKAARLQKKESRKEERQRRSREEFRERLKEEKLYLFDGTLYSYEDGKRFRISKNVSMLDSLYRSMVEYEPFVYLSKKITFGSYELKKEGMEEIGSVYDMVVNLVDGQIRNYNINYETLLYYPEHSKEQKNYEVIMCCEDKPYKVKGKRLAYYKEEEDQEEELHRSSVCREGDATYYISCYQDYALCREEKGHSKRLIAGVESYQVRNDGTVVVLAFDEEKAYYVLYLIKDGDTPVAIENNVTELLGDEVYSSKDWE